MTQSQFTDCPKNIQRYTAFQPTYDVDAQAHDFSNMQERITTTIYGPHSTQSDPHYGVRCIYCGMYWGSNSKFRNDMQQHETKE